jgi:hypothetical protein
MSLIAATFFFAVGLFGLTASLPDTRRAAAVASGNT